MYFATCFDVLKDKLVSLNASLFVLVLLSASLVVMASIGIEQPSARLGRMKWTDQMNCDLLDCKKKALAVTKSDKPPLKEDGKKKGYMRVMKELWEEMGYENLALTSQNLRDQAARLEKTLGNVAETISRRVGMRENQTREENLEIEEFTTTNSNLQEEADPNLHTPLNAQRESEIVSPVGIPNTLNEHARGLLESSAQILASINSNQGDFTNREIDTRTKRRPTGEDIANIDKVIGELMKQNVVNPSENPFGYLWLANCVIYSVVVAFLLLKGWKKQRSSQTQGHRSKEQKWKTAYEEKVHEIRKMISIAKAELERLRENRKITKKGRKNRNLLKEECKTISAFELVNFMERKKSALRKLKKGFSRKKKQEESRIANRDFKLDPGQVYANMNEMLKKDENTERPKYKIPNQEEESDMFENIEEASNFWKELWEKKGTGNRCASWLEEVKTAINQRVPAPSSEDIFVLEREKAVKVIRKKRNWSAPGPDRITNFWWKQAQSLQEGVVKTFQAMTQGAQAYPLWFSGGKTSLIPKPGEFASDNQRPITCLNTLYKWFTSCLLKPMDHHLETYALMEGEQRGAKKGCSGTIDNLLIDRMVTQDCHRGRRNLSMAWIDVKKAYDSVDHEWLMEMMQVHRFPEWMVGVVQNLSTSWNTRVVITTRRGREKSEMIKFNRGLPQGDALCPRLFTLCMNPIAWKVRATEGYTLSRPISTRVTDLLYIDDLKIFAASESKLNTVLKSTKSAMEDIGLQWNPKKCSTIHVRKGVQVQDSLGIKMDESMVITSLKEGKQYKFLGVLENLKQDDKLALKVAAKVFLRRLSVIWSSPLSDFNRVIASNQFALPVMSYLMWTQNWPITELKRIDREARKIIVENGGKHPLSSTALLYLTRGKGGRGMRSVEREYKSVKVKAAVNLYKNPDLTMETVRKFEERSVALGHQSLVKDAVKYAEELELTLNLTHPQPSLDTDMGEVPAKKIKAHLKKSQEEQLEEMVRDQKWQGKLLRARWEDESLNKSGCFAWLNEWRSCPSNVIAGMFELYEQLLPTKLYHSQKTRTIPANDVQCRLCNKTPESVAHVLSGCSALAQNKYLARHNAALKILFFEILRDLGLLEEVPPWYSPVEPKPTYESRDAQAFWDIPVYAVQTEVRANRVDARIINHKAKKVTTLEMSCPWIMNRTRKDAEKTLKYGPMRWELKQQFKGYVVEQHNIIIDVLGGWSNELEEVTQKLLGARGKYVLRSMQKSVISSSLNIARMFKVMI